MIKNYSFKIILLSVLLSLSFIRTSAQYAVGGSAGLTLAHSVYWLTWDPTVAGSTLISSPAGTSASNVPNGTYVWKFSPTVRITGVVSNITSPDAGHLTVYTPGTYQSDGLDLIYSGNNLPKPNSRGVANSALATSYGNTVTFNISITVAILINNVWTNVNYPGMVIGDAESIDAMGEYISGDTPNSIAWQLLNKRTQGQAEDSHYKMDLSNSGRSFKLYADLQPGNFGVQAVMFAHGATSVNNLSMKGSGITAIAVGFVLPFDLGDAPLTYGSPGSYIDQFKTTDYYTGDGTYAVVNYDTTALVPQATVYIGDNNVDADGQPVGGPLANNDDITGNNDENSLVPSTLPNVKVNQSGDISFTVPVTNTKNIPATLRAWIDFNGDGIFTTDESIAVTIPAATSSKSFTLTFPNASFASKLRAGPLYARLRVTTSTLVDDAATAIDERSTSFSADGEIEDYKLKDALGLVIAGKVFDDGNGGKDGSISGSALSTVSGQPLYAYLVDNTGKIIGQSLVGSDGSYSFAGSNNGNYTVAISTNNVDVGGSLSAIPADLPTGWVPSGAAYGTNNTAGTGIQTGTPNLQIKVTTPGASQDVTGLNFGINKAPVATADTAQTVTATPVTVNPPAHDSDTDGSLNLTSVLLIDPADNTKKTSLTVPGEGTYTVNTTNGQVTFVPLPTFSGQATPIAYTIKDNYGTESESALINIFVKAVPLTGVADTTSTPINTPVTTTVKANDGIAAANATVTPTNGAHGKTTVNAAGQVTYTPDPGFTGVDTYTYTLTNNGLKSAPITVTVNVYTSSVALTKTGSLHGTVAVGGLIDYTLVVTNTGTSTLTNVVVTDPGVDDGSITPATIASLAPGASATVTASHTINQSDINFGSYSNQASVSGQDPSGATITKSKSDDPSTPAVDDPTTVQLPAPGSVTLVKTGVFSANYITYSFVVTNTGNNVLNPVDFTDLKLNIADSVITPNGGLQPGATITFTVKYILTQQDKGSGSVSNTGTVDATDLSGNIVKAFSTVVTDVPKSPTALDDAATTYEAEPVKIPVLKNDNPGTATFDLTTVEIINQPAHGTVVVNSDGTVTYTPNAGYTGSDNFTYRVKDQYGYYTNVANVVVTINAAPAFKIPTLFTPNGDGLNDVFEIRGLEQYDQNTLIIVNRWGNEVYHQTNYQNNWAGDGLNEGTYYYVLRVKNNADTDWKTFKGYTTLIRAFKKN